MKHKTSIKTISDQDRKWYLIDAKGQKIGKVSVTAVKILEGKNNAYYSPFLDCGDNVVIINVKDLKVNQKISETKEYFRYSGYPGGLKSLSLGNFMKKNPVRVLEISIKGMLPKNKLADKMFKKVYIYEDQNHKFQDKNLEKLM